MFVALNPGHNCPPDTGAVGYEKEDFLTLVTVRHLTSLLEQAGHKVLNVLPSSCSSVNQSLRARVMKANQQEAQLYVSIHFNAANGKASGTEVFAVSAVGRQYARSVLQEIVKLKFINRGVKDGSKFFELNNTSMPAILVECCFVDSKEDMNLFDASEMAEAIARGICAVAGGSIPDRSRERSPTGLKITQDTVLKQEPIQAADITDPRAKFSVKAGQLLGIGRRWKEQQAHIQVELLNPVNNFRLWWVYAPHCSLMQGDRALKIADAPGAPATDRILPPDEPIPPVAQQLIALPGYKVDLNSPIVPGGYFFWKEALHGGTRLPRSKQIVENIITLAKLLKSERVRERLGGVPIMVTSWYRPEPYNSRAGGEKDSRHLTGIALDFLREGLSGREMASRLSDWPGGMGIYAHLPGLLHLDARAYRARWGGA